MFSKVQPVAKSMWRKFRNRSLFVKCLLVVPVICAISFTLLIGNMGLALLGFAVPLYGWFVGAVGGLVITIFAKAASIIHKDKRSAKRGKDS
ncbi:MAG: hypothetical protein ABJE00_06525 [Erythrobacter sp.]